MLELIMLGYCECKREIIIEKRLDRFREGSTHVANKKGRGTVSSLESPQTFQQLQKPGCSKEQFILSFLVFLFSIHSLIRKFPTILNDCLLKSCPTKKAWNSVFKEGILVWGLVNLGHISRIYYKNYQ